MIRNAAPSNAVVFFFFYAKTTRNRFVGSGLGFLRERFKLHRTSSSPCLSERWSMWCHRRHHENRLKSSDWISSTLWCLTGLKRKWIVSLEGFSNPLFSIAAEWPLIVDWCSWNLTLPFPLRSCSLILCPCRVVVALPCDTKHRELWTTTSANCWFIFFVSWKVNPQREFQLYIPTHRLRRKSVNWNSFLFRLWCGVGVA